MKVNYSPYFTLLICSFLMCSCIAYQPQMVGIPLIHEKNDVRVDAGLSIVQSCIGGTVSYGVSDKIALQVHANTVIDGEKHNYVQVAGGYYKHFKNNQVLEVYGGGGYGNIYTHSPATGGHIDGRQQLYFSQVNFGKINIADGKVDVGVGLKTGVLFSNIQDHNYFYNTSESDLTYDYRMLLGEPTAFVGFGGEKVKFNIKASAVALHQLSDNSQAFPFSRWNLGFGVSFNF